MNDQSTLIRFTRAVDSLPKAETELQRLHREAKAADKLCRDMADSDCEYFVEELAAANARVAFEVALEKAAGLTVEQIIEVIA